MVAKSNIHPSKIHNHQLNTRGSSFYNSVVRPNAPPSSQADERLSLQKSADDVSVRRSSSMKCSEDQDRGVRSLCRVIAGYAVVNALAFKVVRGLTPHSRLGRRVLGGLPRRATVGARVLGGRSERTPLVARVLRGLSCARTARGGRSKRTLPTERRSTKKLSEDWPYQPRPPQKSSEDFSHEPTSRQRRCGR